MQKGTVRLSVTLKDSFIKHDAESGNRHRVLFFVIQMFFRILRYSEGVISVTVRNALIKVESEPNPT